MSLQVPQDSVPAAAALLAGTVVPSRVFARAMRVLGQVVESDYSFRSPDHSAYQRWLREQYLKELPDRMAKGARKLPSLLAEEARLASLAEQLQADASDLAEGVVSALGEDFILARKYYWEWLYEHDRAQWFLLDPVITVAPETLFFEALSTDESTYVRVSLPTSAIELSGPIRPGCTNIDYSPALDRVLARARSYRPLEIEVSEDGLRIGSAELRAHEAKIDPPESWMRSFAEVQAVFGLAPLTLEVSPGFFADIVAALRARKARQGPRALVFHLEPGQPIRVELQPWGATIIDRGHTWSGVEATTVKVWGRRRLELLAPLLPEATSVTVDLISDGLPSSWTVTTDEVRTTIVLSGWTSRQWAGRASFLGATPEGDADADVVEQFLRGTASASIADVSTATGMNVLEAQRALVALSRSGRATVDLTTGRFVARRFPFAPGATPRDPFSLAERKARDLMASGHVTTQIVELDDGAIEVKGSFWRESKSLCSIVLDEDRRVRTCTCSCPDFQFHGLVNGPCCHLIATLGAMQ